MDLVDEALGVARALSAASVPYAFCGGIAVVIHGYPRVTRDIDLLLPERELDNARAALDPVGFSLSSGVIPFGAGTDQARRIVRQTKVEGSEHLTIDLILVSPVFETVWKTRESFELEGETIWVVSARGLATMKSLAGRPQDLQDLEGLREAGKLGPEPDQK